MTDSSCEFLHCEGCKRSGEILHRKGRKCRSWPCRNRWSPWSFGPGGKGDDRVKIETIWPWRWCLHTRIRRREFPRIGMRIRHHHKMDETTYLKESIVSDVLCCSNVPLMLPNRFATSYSMPCQSPREWSSSVRPTVNCHGGESYWTCLSINPREQALISRDNQWWLLLPSREHK